MWSGVFDNDNMTEGSTGGADWIARIRRLEEEVNGLRRAQRSRGLIEQAKGMLAERMGTDPETAFKHLSQQSQRRNIPVVDLATEMVAGGAPAPKVSPLKRAAAAVPGTASLAEMAEVLWR